MRVAVVSDIHSNLHALEAVLAAIEAEAPDELWCLGDLVGYGPRPNECCALIADRADVCLAGNHDLGVLGTIDLVEFGGEAGIAARWTRDVLDPEARAGRHRAGARGRAGSPQPRLRRTTARRRPSRRLSRARPRCAARELPPGR